MSDESGDVRRVVIRGMQVAIGLILAVGVVTGNLSVAVNAVFALGITFLPAVLRRDWDIVLDADLSVWITAAVLLHAVGMLGPYSTVDWWDHVTHTLSASLVAGVGYAAVRAFDDHSDAVYFPPQFLFVFVLLFTLALGVFWEVLELAARVAADAAGMDAVLVQYGLTDTLVDLIFDTVGAVAVSLFGTNLFATMTESLTRKFDRTDPR